MFDYGKILDNLLDKAQTHDIHERLIGSSQEDLEALWILLLEKEASLVNAVCGMEAACGESNALQEQLAVCESLQSALDVVSDHSLRGRIRALLNMSRSLPDLP